METGQEARSTNGIVAYPEVTELGDTTPHTFDVRVDGEIKTAYITTDRRYPRTRAAALDDALREYRKTRELDDSDGPPPPQIMEVVRDMVSRIDGTSDLSMEDVLVYVDYLRRGLDAYDKVPRYKFNGQAWEHYLNKACMILVPGLTYDQADNMDPDKRMNLLLKSGYLHQQAAAGEDQNPPDQAPASTGGKPGQRSRGSTT